MPPLSWTCVDHVTPIASGEAIRFASAVAFGQRVVVEAGVQTGYGVALCPAPGQSRDSA